ncbi:TPA: FRG domain-containing protein [Vibrio parahaemolyticus]|nr:FRG domain-containing protein [Vibrio parahaemolyticus]HAS6755788.1 FRG domain-containing protein [Vibrio parahaemolyticus]HAS6775245.1 FRG domain-containing protein [Vibrio parahaemolyticus]
MYKLDRSNILKAIFDQIEEARTELGSWELLYRGHSSREYQLLPTLHRSGKQDYERALFYNYKASSASLNRGVTKSNWDIVLDMQHYGLPTRLLDWTSSLGAALYFALKGNPGSPCIWLLNPYKLNGVSTGSEILYDVSNLPDIGGKPEFNFSQIMAGNCEYEIPYAIRPPHGNSRISAQRGLFTVHTKYQEPLEVLCPDAIKRIDIQPDKVQEYKRYLSFLGIDEFSMFPDQEGLANHLKQTYAL